MACLACSQRAGVVAQDVTPPGPNGLGAPNDAGDVWEIMGMEHDVTEDPWQLDLGPVAWIRALFGYLGVG